MIRLPFFLICLVLIALSACAGFDRSDSAASAKARMIGMSREEVLSCMGPPKKKSSEGVTEVWSYLSTDYAGGTDSTQASLGGGVKQTHSSHSRNFCTVNVVMKNGVVSRVNYNGPSSSSLLTHDDQCGYAVSNCVGGGE